MKFLSTAVFICCTLACSKQDDPGGKQPTTTGNVVTVDGKAFTPTDTKATNTGTGLSISLKEGSKEIVLSTSDKSAGTYVVANSVPGRINALSATVSYFDGTDLFFGASGSIVITIDASGKALDAIN